MKIAIFDLMNKNQTIRNSIAEFSIFTTTNKQDIIEVEDETVCLTQNPVKNKIAMRRYQAFIILN